MLKILFEGPEVNEITKYRIGGRSLIQDEESVLFSYLKKRNQYLLPGGGLDLGEKPEEGILRETVEECGLLTEVEAPYLLVIERYGSLEWRTYYSKARIIEKVECKMDEKEIELSLTPTWFNINDLQLLPKIEMTYEDIKNKSNEVKFAVKNSHFQEYIATLIGIGRLDIVDFSIPNNIRDSLERVTIYD